MPATALSLPPQPLGNITLSTSTTMANTTNQIRQPLRRAVYVHVSDLTSAYNIDHARLEEELARVKREREQAATATVAPAAAPVASVASAGSPSSSDANNLSSEKSVGSSSGKHSLGGVPTELDTTNYMQKRLQPPRGGYNLCVLVGTVEVVVDKYRVDGSRVRLAEVEVGDETGTVSLRARDDQIDTLKEVSSRSGAVVLRNCTLELYQGKHIRMAITKWGKLSTYPDQVPSTPPPPSKMNQDRNFSLIDLSVVASEMVGVPHTEQQYHYHHGGHPQQSQAMSETESQLIQQQQQQQQQHTVQSSMGNRSHGGGAQGGGGRRGRGGGRQSRGGGGSNLNKPTSVVPGHATGIPVHHHYTPEATSARPGLRYPYGYHTPGAEGMDIAGSPASLSTGAYPYHVPGATGRAGEPMAQNAAVAQQQMMMQQQYDLQHRHHHPMHHHPHHHQMYHHHGQQQQHRQQDRQQQQQRTMQQGGASSMRMPATSGFDPSVFAHGAPGSAGESPMHLFLLPQVHSNPPTPPHSSQHLQHLHQQQQQHHQRSSSMPASLHSSDSTSPEKLNPQAAKFDPSHTGGKGSTK